MLLLESTKELMSELCSLWQAKAKEDADLELSHFKESDQFEQRAGREQRESRIASCLLALDVLLKPGTLDKALQLCRPSSPAAGNKAIVKVVAKESRRNCWHIKGETGTYVCVEGFCSCWNFVSQVEKEVPLCKHLVAIQLGQILGAVGEEVVSDEEYGSFLCT